MRLFIAGSHWLGWQRRKEWTWWLARTRINVLWSKYNQFSSVNLRALKTKSKGQRVKPVHPSTAVLKPPWEFSFLQTSSYWDMCVCITSLHKLVFFNPPTLLCATLNIWDWETSNYISQLSYQVAKGHWGSWRLQKEGSRRLWLPVWQLLAGALAAKGMERFQMGGRGRGSTLRWSDTSSAGPGLPPTAKQLVHPGLRRLQLWSLCIIPSSSFLLLQPHLSSFLHFLLVLRISTENKDHLKNTAFLLTS